MKAKKFITGVVAPVLAFGLFGYLTFFGLLFSQEVSLVII